MTAAPLSRFRRLLDAAAVVCFGVILWLPLLDRAFDLDATPPLEEARRPVERPGWPEDAGALAAWPARFGAWWNGHFGFRDALVRGYNGITVLGLGATPLARTTARSASLPSDADEPDDLKVLVGREGWLFLGAPRIVDDYRGLSPLEHAGLVAWQEALEARRDWLAERGIHYLAVVVPDKNTVYPEFMPAKLRRDSDRTRLDQLLKFLARESDVPLLDLRAPLLAAKPRELVYARTDSHWTGHGAYLAYRGIVERLAAWFPHVAPLSAPELAFRVDADGPRDLARMLGLELWLREPVVQLARPEPRAVSLAPHEMWGHDRLLAPPVGHAGGDPDGPRIVFLYDSFGVRLTSVLADHAARLTCYLRHPFEPALFDAERPDVVIEQWAERIFVHRPPDAPEIVRRHGLRERQRRIERAMRAAVPLLRAGSESGFAALVPNGQLAVSSGGGASPARLVLNPLGPHPRLRVRDLELPRGQTVYLHLELAASRPGEVSLLYTTQSSLAGGIGLRIARPVEAGDNRMWFELSAPDLVGSMAIEISPNAGRVALQALEIAASPPRGATVH
jgi:hypothetical protein